MAEYTKKDVDAKAADVSRFLGIVLHVERYGTGSSGFWNIQNRSNGIDLITTASTLDDAWKMLDMMFRGWKKGTNQAQGCPNERF